MSGQIIQPDNSASDVWANTACRSKANEAWLSRNMLTSRIHRRKQNEKADIGGSIARKWQEIRRPRPSRACLRSSKEPLRSVHMLNQSARTEAKFTLANLACNMERLIFHERREAAG